MKKLLILLLLAVPFICKAQTDTSNYQKKIAYCTVETQQSGSKFIAALDDGTTTKYSAMEIKDSKGKPLKFKSRITILDYMTQRGWTLVSSYGSANPLTIVDFIFERPVVADK